MNFFEFYGLEVAFQLDEDQLRTTYLKKSKEFHPDFFTANSDEQLDAVEKTSLNNQVFGTLKNFNKRVKYILELNGLLEEGKSKVPQMFLIEMMDFNEKLMDLKMEPDASLQKEIEEEFGAMQRDLNDEMLELAKSFDQVKEEQEKNTFLLAVRDNYLKQKYLNRIQENLEAEL